MLLTMSVSHLKHRIQMVREITRRVGRHSGGDLRVEARRTGRGLWLENLL